jgi:hypothetical protein
MGRTEQYERGLKKLLEDKTICKPNRDLFKKFFNEQEYKLKRKRGLRQLNDRVLKTLLGYINRFRNVNSWFKNKDWTKLTKQDIKKVYDDLEDEKLLSRKGTPFKDKQSYYNKIFKSKPFRLVGKDNLAKEVIETYYKENKEVRYVTEEDFKKAVSVVIKSKHKLALWLCWDVGENSSSIVQLKKRDCKKHFDEETKELEYHIRLKSEILKTNRTQRTEPTLYLETVQLLDIILKDKKDEDLLFDFGQAQLDKIWRRAINITKIKCEPDGQIPTLKDLRSGMACNLLEKVWTTDEIKSRMGHKPSSTVLDVYVNYKALNKKKTKRKLYDSNLQKIKEELEAVKEKEKLNTMRIEEINKKFFMLSKRLSGVFFFFLFSI